MWQIKPPIWMTRVMKTTKTSKRARVRLIVQCGDEPRIFEITLRSAKAARAEGFQRAITQAAAAFSKTFSEEMKRLKHPHLRPL